MQVLFYNKDWPFLEMALWLIYRYIPSRAALGGGQGGWDPSFLSQLVYQLIYESILLWLLWVLLLHPAEDCLNLSETDDVLTALKRLVFSLLFHLLPRTSHAEQKIPASAGSHFKDTKLQHLGTREPQYYPQMAGKSMMHLRCSLRAVILLNTGEGKAEQGLGVLMRWWLRDWERWLHWQTEF